MPKLLKKSSKRSLLSRAKPVSEIESYTAMLIYGDSGTGKTAFASTAPKPALILDLKERGTETVRMVKGIDVISIETWEEFEEMFWELKDD